MARFITLVVFIIVLQVVGFLIGTSFPADSWYDTLAKPFFNPPGWVFGVVWPFLYLLIAFAGWRVLIAGGDKPGWGLWVAQMLMNWAWSPLFFGAHAVFWAMVLLAATFMAALAFAATLWDRDRLTAVSFVPYVVWLGFALVLNFSIWIMN